MQKQAIPMLKLSNGVLMPQLGLGTWKLWGDECVKAVKAALDAGYRHIDTAERYANQSDIGMAIKGHPRKSLFITSKVWYDHLHHDDLIEACTATLEELRTDYVDMYIIHWPNSGVPFKETFGALNELYRAKKIRATGVSNFSISNMRKAMKVCDAPITNNQIETHPFWHDEKLLGFCRENDIVVTAYSPLAQGKVFHDMRIIALAEKYGKNPGQLTLRWLVQKGCAVIPKASEKIRLVENMSIFDFEISGEDMRILDSLKPQKRMVNADFAEWD